MNLGFIGIGKIASSAIRGICTADINDIHLYLSPRSAENATSLANQFDFVTKMEDNQQVVDRSTIVFIAVPPSQAESVLEGLRFREDHIVVSFVAFLSYDKLQQKVGPAVQISRAVPLPAVELHTCPILVYKSYPAVTAILEKIGQPLEVESEAQLQVLWSLTGLIAPFYDLNKKLTDWATGHGVDPAITGKYLMEFYRSLSSIGQRKEPIDFLELIKDASTARGMNEQALQMISQEQVHDAYVSAAETILKRF